MICRGLFTEYLRSTELAVSRDAFYCYLVIPLFSEQFLISLIFPSKHTSHPAFHIPYHSILLFHLPVENGVIVE